MALVTSRMKALCYKKAFFVLNSLAQFKLLKVFRSELFCTIKHIVHFKISSFKDFENAIYVISNFPCILKQYTKSNPMICNSSIFGKIFFVVTVNYDVIGIQAMGDLEKCGRIVFNIILPTDNFETIKNGITQIARLLQQFPCLRDLTYFFP